MPPLPTCRRPASNCGLIIGNSQPRYHYGATLALHKVGAAGTLRGAAVAAGIPAVAFELGEPGTLQLEHVRFGVKAIDTLLDKLDMVDRFRLWSEPQPVYYQSSWMRAHQGGILTSSVQPGAIIRLGDTLGRIINPLTSDEIVIISPHDGRILGRALNQFVLPGFAIFHIGIEAPTVRDAEAPLFEDGANPPDAMPDSDGESPDEPEGGDDVPGGLSDDELH